MKALFDSIVRTIVPVLVGSALSVFAQIGLNVDPEFETALTTVLFAGFTSLYYVVARVLETHVAPKFGWLLGLPRQPEYASNKED